MSDLLNSASLVMIPSGYKEDVVYSEVPTNGNGDLSFTRASNGTRVNSAGLVEDVPWNLAGYSEEFDNAYWTKSNATITANNTTAPNGTTTADKFAPNGTLTSSYFGVGRSITNNIIGQNYTETIYVKAGTITQMLMYLGSSNGIYWNLSNGQFISYYSGVQNIIAYNSEAIGDGWYKYTITINAPNTTIDFEIYGAKSGAFIGNYTTADNFFGWGAQLNIGSTAKPYFPTTDRLNVPRLTYQNGGGGCPSLLLEKQSTNLFTYSEQFDNANWTKNNTTITANAITSPDGTQNADKIADSINTASAFYFYQSPATTSTQYTSSGYFKKGEYNFVTLHAFGLNGAVFNLNTGVLVSQSGGTGTIQSVGDGWYRCTFTFTAGGSAVFFSQSPAGNISYTGTIGSGIYAWGLQVEASSYPTSYIPTTSSSATRVADVCSKTGISSLIGQTEGVIYWEGYVTPVNNWNSLASVEVLSVRFINLRLTTTNMIELGSSGLSTDFNITSSTPAVLGTYYKIAGAYKSGQNVLYVNGVQIGTTATTFTTPTLSEFRFDVWNVFNEQKSVAQAILFPTRLTNAELASLTTL